MGSYHFIGIGGIGMSALARILKEKGADVQGSDTVSNYITDQLISEGILVSIGHDSSKISAQSQVIYSTSIDKNNEELAQAKQQKQPILHRSEMLNFLMKGYCPLLVAGTHGKTTTTALLSWVLWVAKQEPCFAIGGVLRRLNTNAHYGKGKYFIAEADESDGSFLNLEGSGAIVTGIEEDHFEHWHSKQDLENAFKSFYEKITDKNLIFWCKDDPELSKLTPPGTSYGFSPNADVVITNFRQKNFMSSFTLYSENQLYTSIHVSLIGRHNVLNAASVFALALRLGIDEKVIRKAFKTFPGVKRRLEIIKEISEVIFIDDYAHHPTAIEKTLEALRTQIKEKRLIVLFEPHRISRVQRLTEPFSKSFKEADIVIVTDIFTASEEKSSYPMLEELIEKIQKKSDAEVIYIPKKELVDRCYDMIMPHDVFITMGAGENSQFIKQIAKKYAQKPKKLKLAFICGGQSIEHEVSVLSTNNVLSKFASDAYEIQRFGITRDGLWLHGDDVIEKLKNNNIREAKDVSEIVKELKKCDVIFPLLHGANGEDGVMQGFLKILQLPYIGCDTAACALCMNKVWAKKIVAYHHLATAPFIEITRQQWIHNNEACRHQLKKLNFPLYVKPNHGGSTVGVSRIPTWDEVEEKLQRAFEYDEEVIVEEEIVGKQIEYALKGNEHIEIAVPVELGTMDNAMYTYDQKYFNSEVPLIIPADIDKEKVKEGKRLAKKIYQLLGCKGWTRIDFFLDRDNQYIFNEANPIPGMTPKSPYPLVWEKSHVKIDRLIHDLIIYALHQHRKLQRTGL